MPTPENLSADMPDEVKIVLRHLKPEPESLAQERERLLTALEAQAAFAREPLRQLLETMRSVLVSRRPEAAFQPRFASQFASALERVQQDPDAPPLPGIFRECFTYLREYLSATGLGFLLEAVDEDPAEQAPPVWQARDTQELTTRIKFGHIRD